MDNSKLNQEGIHSKEGKINYYENLELETVPKGEVLVDEFGVKYSADGKQLIEAPFDIEEYSIREGTEIICGSAFQHCEHLHKIDIPEGIVLLGALAFYDCQSLSEIILPNSLKVIYHNAFGGCNNLQELLIPSGVEYINGNPCCGCNIHINSLSPLFLTKEDILYDSNKTELISCCQSYDGLGLNLIVGESDYSSLLKSYGIYDDSEDWDDKITIIPNKLNKIGYGAFINKFNLKSVFIPNNVEIIDTYAFAGCRDIIEILGNPCILDV